MFSVVTAAALLVLAAPAATASATAVSLSPTLGPPTTLSSVGGAGFAPGEAVQISFDGIAIGSATADGSGVFSGVQVQVPADAQPGSHQVAAGGQSSGVTAQRAFVVRTNWAQPGFSAANSRFNSYENVLSPANVSALAVRWTSATGGLWQPIAAGGRIYAIGEDGGLHALNAATGAELWASPGNLAGVPAFASNTVYALGRDDRLYAFEASGGRLRWAAGTAGVRISYPGPVVSGGRVYVVQNDAEGDHLYAFDAASGATAWSAAPDSYYSFSGAPAVVGNVVYAVALGGNPYYDGHVYALDAASGARLWLGQAYTNGIGGWPTVAGGRVYAPAGEGNWTEVFRASSGAYLGRREGAGTITVGNGVGYADSFDAIELLSAWNERTGSVLWHRGGDNEPLIPGGSALANGVLYVTTDYGRLLYALDAASGQTLAKITIGTGAYGSFSPPVVADGVVYLSSDGNIEAIGLPKT